MSELKPQISTGRRFNPIWVVPVVAIVVGLYMVIHTKLTEGPEVTIQFNTAEGLEAGKTKLRYRDVDVGVVESVSLNDARDKVVITAKMDREAADMLREDTRFWVVRARVGAGAISGLGTILSGAYIQLDPGNGKRKKKTDYIGLELPPLTPADAPGVRLVLYSENAGSLSAGDPIVYNGYKVGRIESVTFDVKDKVVRYDTFIDAPYNDLVTAGTRFWDVSGITVNATAAGINVSTGSMETILLGGVAFGNLPGVSAGKKAVSGDRYKLNASYEALEEDPFLFKAYFVVEFAQSLRGLEPGAPVEYRGIQIGRVERILIKELVSKRAAGSGEPIPVLVYLEPARFGLEDSAQSVDGMYNSVAAGVKQGMRASLQTGNLLSGALYINLDYYKDTPEAKIGRFGEYPVLPSIPSGLGRLEQQVSQLLDKLNALDVEPLLGSANTAMGTLDVTLASLTSTMSSLQVILDEEGTKALPNEIGQTLAELRKTLGSLSPESAAGQSLSNSVFELNRTLRNLEELTRNLSTQPSSLVFPSETPADPIPEARPQ
ncbi:MAG: intermembrane transport protein PqiB [Pseudomonadales bacterium]|nr:intermembrane transport protein PqiB [Pseudomonadales bacterium]